MTTKTATSAVPGTEAKTTVAAKAVTTKETVNPNRIRDTQLEVLWTVIGLEDCAWSKAAVTLLKDHEEHHKYMNLSPEWHRRLVVEFNTRRLPAIFRGPSYFGSYSDLENYYKCSFIRDDERF